MSNLKTIKEWGNKLSLTRRNFLKGSLAIGASVAVLGCDSDGVDTGGGGSSAGETIRYGTSGHNCGSRCVSRAHVVNGKITRFSTVEEEKDSEGTVFDTDNENCAKSIPCSRCRSYKSRLYHPGRLKYSLKQTKRRGDLSGFVRIDTDKAIEELGATYKAITGKYGIEAYHPVYACGAIGSDHQGGGYYGLLTGLSWGDYKTTFLDKGYYLGTVGKLLGGFLPNTNDYSFFAWAYFGTQYTGYDGGVINASVVANKVKNLVLWGSNILTTDHAGAHAWISSINKMRDRDGKVTYIGPELVDTGVTLADEWIKIRPYTDTAVVMGMIYHLIDGTFNSNGTLKGSPLLDVNYIDTMVHGFFDSPEYWVHAGKPEEEVAGGTNIPAVPGTGKMTFIAPTTNIDEYIKVAEVPNGKSLSAYIMGSDNRLTSAKYVPILDNATNYTAKMYATKDLLIKRAAPCSYSGVTGTKYKTKADYKIQKTPAWASAISGVPEATIKALAELYADKDNHPIHSEWAGGATKQAEGVHTFFALQSLLILTKTWGEVGSNYTRQFANSLTPPKNALELPFIAKLGEIKNPQSPIVSCLTWENAIKFAFGDELNKTPTDSNLIKYEKNIPDWTTTPADGTAYFNDAATKSLVKWDRDTDGSIKVDANGYYKPMKDGSGNLIYSGIRFIMNAGGGMLANQHMNTTECKRMYEALPLAGGADNLCLVSLDNFLSPSPRWSDYVIPATTLWEQEDFMQIELGNAIYIPVVSTPPGESLSPYQFSAKFLKAAKDEAAATALQGGVAGSTFESHVINAMKANDKYKGMTMEQYLAKPYLSKIGGNSTTTSDAANSTALRHNIKAYLLMNDAKSKPFIYAETKGVTEYVKVHNYSLDGVPVPFPTNIAPVLDATEASGYGDLGVEFSIEALTTKPTISGKFELYSDRLVWRYENRYSKFHGHITNKDDQGEINKDLEGDVIVNPIAMYHAYEDYFNEAYGFLTATTDGNAGRLTNGLEGYQFLLTTAHDRFRAHSSQAENPLLRELTHKTRKGKRGQDWKEHALLKNDNPSVAVKLTIPTLNNIGSANTGYVEVWLKKADGIVDGDLCLIENPIGKILAIARLSNRCVENFIGLHQGCWYDPQNVVINGGTAAIVDVGGCANTLMASKLSRVDHGNAQQSAMVNITKVTSLKLVTT